MSITQPRGLSLQDWADSVVRDLSVFGLIGRLDGDDWQRWGSQFRNNLSVGRDIPDPYDFKEWPQWAERVCGVLS